LIEESVNFLKLSIEVNFLPFTSEVIRRFVTESEFSSEIKAALMQCIALEVQGKPVGEYLTLVKQMATEN
jgi:hypothetical protein